jgi:hypothetical protein
MERRGEGHGALARRGLPHGLEPGCGCDEAAGRDQEGRLVVDDEDPDGL